MSETVIDLMVIGLVILLVFGLASTLFPSLLAAIQKAISDAVKNGTASAVESAGQAAAAVGKGAVYGAGALAGADPYEVDHTFSGNPSPSNAFLYGPDRFSLGSLWGAVKGWWAVTFNPALDSGAAGPSAGGFPIGTDVSNYDAGNGEVIYAPPPKSFAVDQPTQDLLNYLESQS